MYLISIITITFNDLDGLKKTIDSIDKNYNSLITNINHIIIDGNSTDGTKMFLGNNLTERSINTIIISEPDSGIYDAMNKGITICNNMYILFMNAGDTFYDVNTLNIVNNKLVVIIVNKAKCITLGIALIFLNIKNEKAKPIPTILAITKYIFVLNVNSKSTNNMDNTKI